MSAFYYLAVKTSIYLFVHLFLNIFLFIYVFIFKKAYVPEGRKAEAASASLVEIFFIFKGTHLSLGKKSFIKQ